MNRIRSAEELAPFSAPAAPAPRVTVATKTRARAPVLHALTPLLIFACVFAFMSLWQGTRLVTDTNDEGIILDAAQRMLGGQRPYADFFGYMSPGSYWIQAGVFRVLGVSLFAARVPVLCDVALQCALLWWLSASLLGRRAAFVCAAFFFWLQTWDLTMITAQHRFDSATLALAAVCCAWKARDGRAWIWLMAAGCLSAAAAICTPSVALAGVAIFIWILAEPVLRRWWFTWLAGALIVSGAAAGVLWRQGILRACADQMLWLQQHYGRVNVMPYGAVNGGYGGLLGTASGAELVARCFVVFWVALPAILPVVGIAAGLLWMTRRNAAAGAKRSRIVLLTVSAAALVFSTFPRMDVAHLAWVLAIPFLLAFAAVASLPSVRAQGIILAVFCFSALLFLPRWLVCLTESEIATPVGHVRVAAADRAGARALLSNVRAGDGLYVHPYMPLLYFLTQGKNPTHYSYIAPGMMSDADAESILADLRRKPPTWVMYLRVQPREYLRMFPSADPASVQYPRLENWISKHYAATGVSFAGYQLLRRNEPTAGDPPPGAAALVRDETS